MCGENRGKFLAKIFHCVRFQKEWPRSFCHTGRSFLPKVRRAFRCFQKSSLQARHRYPYRCRGTAYFQQFLSKDISPNPLLCNREMQEKTHLHSRIFPGVQKPKKNDISPPDELPQTATFCLSVHTGKLFSTYGMTVFIRKLTKISPSGLKSSQSISRC